MMGLGGLIIFAILILLGIGLDFAGYKRAACFFLFLGTNIFFFSRWKTFVIWAPFIIGQFLLYILVAVGLQLRHCSKLNLRVFIRSLVPDHDEFKTSELVALYSFDKRLRTSLWTAAKYLFFINTGLALFFSMTFSIYDRIFNLQASIGRFFPILSPIFFAILFDKFLLGLVHGQLFKKLDISDKAENHLSPATRFIWMVPAMLILFFYWPYVAYLLSDVSYEVKAFYESLPRLF